MQHYALIGNPVHHSKSPLIHRLFAEQTRINLSYSTLQTTPADFATTVRQFTGHGLNITMPFKTQAFQLMQEVTPRAQRAQAVNTIKIHPDGKLSGDTTDGVGLVRDLLQNLKVPLKNQKILLLGAGGAARGIIATLLQEAPHQVVVMNRTPAAAIQLVNDFADLGPLSAGQESEEGHYDLIINATPASLTDFGLPEHYIKPQGFCYELAYGQQQTPFSLWSARQKAYYSDGLGMLVEQAAESFYHWHGVYPQTQSVLSLLKTG